MRKGAIQTWYLLHIKSTTVVLFLIPEISQVLFIGVEPSENKYLRKIEEGGLGPMKILNLREKKPADRPILGENHWIQKIQYRKYFFKIK